jgi:hypothetical protein
MQIDAQFLNPSFDRPACGGLFGFIWDIQTNFGVDGQSQGRLTQWTIA